MTPTRPLTPTTPLMPLTPLPTCLRDTVTAEIIKMTTAPSARIMLAVALTANLALAAIDASPVGFYTHPGQREPASISSFGAVMLAPVYAFLVVAAHAAASEYRSGQLRITLVAMPNRRSLLAGKIAAMLIVATTGVVIALVPARLIIGISDHLGAGAILLDIARWAAAYLFMSTIAFGLAGLLRSSAAALGILITTPVVVGTGILQWPRVLRFLPDQAALSLLGTPGYSVTALPAATAALTLTTWAAVCLAAYATALVCRDA